MDPPARSTMDYEDPLPPASVDSSEAAAAVIIATTPTGSTELLKGSSSSSASSVGPRPVPSDSSISCNTSDQENKDIVEASAESLALSSSSPTGQLEMPFLVRRKKNKKSSPRSSNASSSIRSPLNTPAEEPQASTPLMESEVVNRTTPLLQLPLPPTTPATSNTSTPQSSIKNAILTRKAQKYSSLKKRRAPNNILNRLFCNNGGLEVSVSGEDDLREDMDLEAQLPMEKTQPTTNAPKQETSRSCIQIGCDIINETSENLTLHDEAIVRQTIQTNIAAMSSPSPSHKTFAQLKQTFEEKRRTNHRSSIVRDDDSTSIATPRINISMVADDLDDLASASSSYANKPKSAKTESPKRKKKSKKTGTLVIPPQFRHPSNYAKDSFKSINHTPPQPKLSSSRSRSPVKKKDSKKSPTGFSLTMSTASTAETSHTSGSEHASLPPEMIRVTTSLEDLSTVPEMSTSKETATKSLDENDLMRQTLTLSSSKLSPNSSKDALARAQSDLRNEFQTDMNQEIKPVASTVSLASSASNKSYETKINSLKDQVALANRLAKLRLDEIQRLEATMDQMRENQEQSNAVKDLNQRLVSLEQQKEEEIQSIKLEMEQRIAELKQYPSPSSRSSASSEQMARVKQELERTKVKLEENEIDVELESQLHQLTDELAKVKRELAQKARELSDIRKVNEDLAVSSSRSMSETDELLRVKKELADLTERLANAALLPRVENERMDVKSGRPPVAVKSRVRSRSSSPSGRSRTCLQQDVSRLMEENFKLQRQVDGGKERSNSKELQSQLKSCREERDELSEQLMKLQEAHDGEKQTILQENSKLRETIEEYYAVEEAMQITSNEQELLREQLQETRAKLSEVVMERDQLSNSIQVELDAKLAKSKEDLRKMKADAERKETEHSNAIERIRQDYDKEKATLLAQLNSNGAAKLVESRLAETEELLQASGAEISMLKRAIAAKEELFGKERIELEGKLQEALHQNEELVQDISHWESKMAATEESHNKQFEELLGQLDLVEADHNETIAARNKIITEKEAAITTLTSRLADANNKVKELEQKVVEEKDRCKVVEKKLEEAETQIRSLRKEIAVVRQTHEKFVEEAAKLQEQACEEAREEMIVKAESQFQQANQHYIKLRKQYEDSQLKVKRLESQIRVSKKASDDLSMEKETIVADLKAQVAKLLAAKAKTEADVARKAKEYRAEIEEARQAIASFETQLARTEQDLQTVTVERDKAVREYEDIKGLSEELMAMVEGGKIGGYA